MKILSWEEIENIGYRKALKEIEGVLDLAIADNREIPNVLLRKLIQTKNDNITKISKSKRREI